MSFPLFISFIDIIRFLTLAEKKSFNTIAVFVFKGFPFHTTGLFLYPLKAS